MKNEIINAIFAEWTNHDFNKASRETIDTVLMLLTDQLNLVTVKDRLLLEENPVLYYSETDVRSSNYNVCRCFAG